MGSRINLLVGLIASWWLIPRAHVLELALGAGVVIEVVARLGGGGLEIPGLGRMVTRRFQTGLNPDRGYHYREVEPFIGEPYPHHWLAKEVATPHT